MGVVLRYEGTSIIAVLEGELDVATVPRARVELEAALVKPGVRSLILDLTGVSFMDSSGLGFLLGRYRWCMENGAVMAVAGARAQVRRVLELSGLTKIMPVTATVGEALARVGREKR